MTIIQVNDINMYYEMIGEGSPLLFIGGLGSSCRNWDYQMQAFSNNFKVITFDLRGHGETDKPEGPYTISLFTKDVAELIKFLKSYPVHVVGLSMGAIIGFKLAIDYPQLIKTLTVVNMGTSFEKKWYYLFLIGLKLLGVKKFAKVVGPKLFIKTEHKEIAQKWMERFSKNDKKILLYSLKALKNWDITNQLPRIQCPTLVISSDRDQTPLKSKKRCVALIPDAKLIIIEDAGHVLPMEKPEKFNKILDEFISNKKF